MVRRIAELYRLLSTRAQTGLALTAGLLVVERLVLAAGALGLTGRHTVTWAASAGVVVLWALRGFVQQGVTKETREKLTMAIAKTALERGGSGSFLPGEEADAAVFEGRNAAEQVIVRHTPSLFGEPIAALVLVYAARPAGVPILAIAAVAVAALLVALLRDTTLRRQRGAWRKYMNVARDTLTSIRAAPELIASGHEKDYLERLRNSVSDWIDTAARAEQNAALFQRIPFAAVVVVAVVLIIQTQTFELDRAIRVGIFFPPLAGFMRTFFELVRTASRIQTLEPALVAHEKEVRGKAETTALRPPPKLPCEIRFEGVSFAYDGTPVLKDVSFVWRPGEVLGLKGPNGSGKSTLLKLMLGLLLPSEGRILVAGVDLREIDLPAWRRGIAYLAQRPYVPERATVIEAMGLMAPDLGEKEARRALEEMGVWERLATGVAGRKGVMAPLQTPIATLSVGVRQRVMLARVFARTKSVLLLDEPDENLDSEGKTTIRSAIHCAQDGRMYLTATHDENLLGAVSVSLARIAK
jgi:ABC-type bacteriocin/lantibiotic exporter with double-glycine peptidase domain